MPGFGNHALVRAIDGIRFRVMETLVYTARDGRVFMVPVGFVTDFASSRVWRWNLLPARAAYSEAAVLHDYLYSTGDVGRADADLLFHESLEFSGVGSFTRWKAYRAVRMFGWKAWDRHRLSDAKENEDGTP